LKKRLRESLFQPVEATPRARETAGNRDQRFGREEYVTLSPGSTIILSSSGGEEFDTESDFGGRQRWGG